MLMAKLDHAFTWTAPNTKGMLDKQLEKVLAYWLAAAGIHMTEHYATIKLQRGASRTYYKLEPPHQEVTQITAAERQSALPRRRL